MQEDMNCYKESSKAACGDIFIELKSIMSRNYESSGY